MVAHAVDAALVGDSSQTAGAGVAYVVTSALAPSSDIAVAGATALYAAGGALAADATIAADLDIFDESMITFVADSSLSGDAFVAKLSDSNLLGASLFAIDPAGFIITRFGRPAAVVRPPPRSPTIRRTPPSPQKPSFTVSADPPRRREER